MKLIPDWKQAWRWHSTQIMAALAALPLVWMELPDDAKAYIPDEWRPFIVAGLAVVGIIGRLRDQP